MKFVKVKSIVKGIYIILFLFQFYSMNGQHIQPMKYLALGDSYTIGERVSEAARWPQQLADSLTKRGMSISKPTIIATTGWRTDDLKNAIASANLKSEYDFVSLLIGVNNQYQGKSSAEYAVEFEELLKLAIHLAKGKKHHVIVLSIPDYGYTPFGKPKKDDITKAIDEFNEINARITYKYGIQYFDITEISRDGLKDPSLIAEDGLHPSGKMYSYWVELIVKDLELN